MREPLRLPSINGICSGENPSWAAREYFQVPLRQPLKGYSELQAQVNLLCCALWGRKKHSSEPPNGTPLLLPTSAQESPKPAPRLGAGPGSPLRRTALPGPSPLATCKDCQRQLGIPLPPCQLSSPEPAPLGTRSRCPPSPALAQPPLASPTPRGAPDPSPMKRPQLPRGGGRLQPHHPPSAWLQQRSRQRARLPQPRRPARSPVRLGTPAEAPSPSAARPVADSAGLPRSWAGAPPSPAQRASDHPRGTEPPPRPPARPPEKRRPWAGGGRRAGSGRAGLAGWRCTCSSRRLAPCWAADGGGAAGIGAAPPVLHTGPSEASASATRGLRRGRGRSRPPPAPRGPLPRRPHAGATRARAGDPPQQQRRRPPRARTRRLTRPRAQPPPLLPAATQPAVRMRTYRLLSLARPSPVLPHAQCEEPSPKRGVLNGERGRRRP